MRQRGISYRERKSEICLIGIPEGEESEREWGNWQYLKIKFPEILRGNNL